MGMEQKEMRQVQVDVSKVSPLFADEVIVAAKIKAFKQGEKKFGKEGNVELIFLDQMTQPPKAISRVVISMHTAAGLLKILGENIQKMEKDLKSKEMPKQPVQVVEKRDKGYLG